MSLDWLWCGFGENLDGFQYGFGENLNRLR